jgi:hypothetical protein
LFAAVEGQSPFNGTSLFDTVVGVVAGESAPLLHAGPLQPVTEGLLAKKPADRLTGEQARMALLDVQQHEHQLFLRGVRVTRDGKQSSAAGWSTGGFCPAKLLMRHRADWNAEAVIGGYIHAETDPSTGDLFGGSAQLRRENPPVWLIRQPRASTPTCSSSCRRRMALI